MYSRAQERDCQQLLHVESNTSPIRVLCMQIHLHKPRDMPVLREQLG